MHDDENHSFLFAEDAEEGARYGLLALMTGISEESWCAGWLSDLEYICWTAREGGSPEKGMRGITARQSELIRLLSEEANGWWIYDQQGPRFVGFPEWQAMLANRTI
jgi:hypothetical protein